MIYEFRCPATATVYMNQAMAEQLLEKIGHSPDSKGVITVQQMAGAVDALKAMTANESDQSLRNAMAAHIEPMIQMLEEAKQANHNITWGV